MYAICEDANSKNMSIFLFHFDFLSNSSIKYVDEWSDETSLNFFFFCSFKKDYPMFINNRKKIVVSFYLYCIAPTQTIAYNVYGQ